MHRPLGGTDTCWMCCSTLTRMKELTSSHLHAAGCLLSLGLSAIEHTARGWCAGTMLSNCAMQTAGASPEQHAGGDVRARGAKAAHTLIAHANVGCRHQAGNQEHAKHTSHQLQTRLEHLHIRVSL